MNRKRIAQLLLIIVMLAVSFGAATRTQAWSACGSTYVVQHGDWLAKIARKCGVTLSELYAANSWVGYYSYIYPGQVLVIPGGVDYYDPYYYCGPGYDYYGSYYIVCRGDTLGGIALYYGVTVDYLQWRPCSIPGGCEGEEWYKYDLDASEETAGRFRRHAADQG